MTSRSKLSSAASFSVALTLRNDIWRSSLILLSASSRTSLGFDRPALANSTRFLGSVAENRSVWRVGGSR